MKKIFYLFIVFLLLCSCKAQNPNLSKESAQSIFSNFLSVKQDDSLNKYFQNCRFEFKMSRNAGAYSCEVPLNEHQKYFLVISDAEELKNEVNSLKRDDKNLIYISYLNYNETLKKISGGKLLFDVNEKIIIDEQPIKMHF